MRIGAVMGLLAVALGAFGAHALKKRLSESDLEVYKTGVLYHLVHAPAVLALGIYQQAEACDAANMAAALLVGGVALFSGSLYALTLSGVRKLGIITPFGGLAMIAGWLVVAVGVVH